MLDTSRDIIDDEMKVSHIDDQEDSKEEEVVDAASVDDDNEDDPHDNEEGNNEDKDDKDKDDADDHKKENDDDDNDEDYVEPSCTTQMKVRPPIIFTNGQGMVIRNASNELTVIIDSAKQRKSFATTHLLSNALYALVERWARKPPYNHCTDVLFSVALVAKEVGFDNPFHLCLTRGWMVKLQKTNGSAFNIEYKRFRKCLKDVPGGEHKALHLKGIVSSLYAKLDTTMAMNATVVRTTIKSNKRGSGTTSESLKRKNMNFEMVHAHDESSYFQQLTQNTKCLQITVFLVNFIFLPFIPIIVDTKLILQVFGGAYSSRRWIELCQGLLLLFDGPVPDKEGALALHKQLTNTNLDVYDYVIGKVSFSKDSMAMLHVRVKEQILETFKRSLLKNFTNRKTADQLVIMRYVVLNMFCRYKGNEISHCLSKHRPSNKSTKRKPLLSDPVLAATKLPLPRFTPNLKKRKINVVAPTPFDFTLVAVTPTLLTTSPGILTPSLSYDEYYSNFDVCFNTEKVCLATSEEVAPFAPRVYTEGPMFETSLYCAPVEFYLLSDLKNLMNGFKCDSLGLVPSVTKQQPTLEIPMACSFITDEFSVIRPGHPVFTKAFAEGKLVINLAICLRFVIEHGTSNRARDGIVSSGREYGSRIDFGCAGSSHHEIFERLLSDTDCEQVKLSIATVYDCMMEASNTIQDVIGAAPMYAYKPRDDVYGSTLRNVLGATQMANEWCTLQVKCVSRGDRTDRHKDVKKCRWAGYNKTGALCFMLVDAFGTLWSLKFLSNSQHVIGSYFDELLGVETLCLRINKHLNEVNLAYTEFLQGKNAITPHNLNWKNPWGFFLNDRCQWENIKDKNKVVHHAFVLPTIIVRDF